MSTNKKARAQSRARVFLFGDSDGELAQMYWESSTCSIVDLPVIMEIAGTRADRCDGGALPVGEGAHPRAYSHLNHKLRSLT